MAFLNPWLWLGALVLSVPVLIHLVRREKAEIIPFSSLMFLLRVPKRSIRQQKLKHLLLMLLRLLILLLLVLAFTRPYLTREQDQAVVSNQSRSAVFLLDTSYSMRYSNNFERMKQETRSRIDGLRSGDRGAIVAFNEKAALLVSPSTDKERLKAAVATLEPSYLKTSYYEAFSLADRVFVESEGWNKELVMVSDFQRSGWNRATRENLVGSEVKTELVDLGVENPNNVGIDSVSVDATTFSRTYNGRIIARISNHTAGQAVTVPVSLVLNDRETGRKSVEIAAKSTALVEFTGFDLPIGYSKGRVKVEKEDPLVLDNEFVFALERRDKLNVLVLDAGRSRQSFFLSQAFSSTAELPFSLKVEQAANIPVDRLADYPVVVINDVPRLPDRVRDRLAELRKTGQGQFVILGDGAEPGWWNNFADMPVRLRAKVFAKERNQPFFSLTSYDRNHPIFKPFEESTRLTLNTAQFFAITDAEAKPGAAVLAKYENGSPAIAEAVGDGGGLIVFTSTADSRWNDLPLKTSFLPLLHESVRYLARYQDSKGWYQLGEAIPIAGGRDVQPAAAILPSGERKALGNVGGGQQHFYSPEIPGFFEFRSGPVAQIVAVNPPSAESDLERMPAEDLLASVRRGPGDNQRTAGLGLEDKEDYGRRQTIWWYFIVLALLAGLVEVFLANRWYSQARENP